MSHHTSSFSPYLRTSAGPPPFPAAPRMAVRSVSDVDIARRAYEIYEARGRLDGFDREDWAAASRELAATRSGT
jgi:hypothetical protein